MSSRFAGLGGNQGKPHLLSKTGVKVSSSARTGFSSGIDGDGKTAFNVGMKPGMLASTVADPAVRRSRPTPPAGTEVGDPRCHPTAGGATREP